MKRYISIDLVELKTNKLTLEEWTLLENIHFMSNNEIGYCFASKETLRDTIQVSNGQIYKIINKLISDGFLYKNKDTGYLKTTNKWNSIASTETTNKQQIESPKNGIDTLQKMEIESPKNGIDTLQKMEIESPKNGIDTLQKMDTKKENIKIDIKINKEKDKKESKEHREQKNKQATLFDLFLKENPNLEEKEKEYANKFIEYRKSLRKPLKTTSPIKALLEALKSLQTLGYSFEYSFGEMMAHEWQTLKLEYIHKPNKPKNLSNGYQSKQESINKAFEEANQIINNFNNNNIEYELIETEVF